MIFPIKVGGLKTTCHQDLLMNLAHYTIVRYKQEGERDGGLTYLDVFISPF